MADIVGAVFPVPSQYVGRLLRGKKTVLVKYLPHATSSRLRVGHKILFYASHGSKNIVGEGTVEEVEFLTRDEVLSKYREQLFLTENELGTYAESQPSRSPSKKLLVLRLKDLRRYEKPAKYFRPITMAGEYVTTDAYRLIKSAVT